MKTSLIIALTACSLLSVQAAKFEYVVYCTGPKESPANGSPGTGAGTVVYDNVAHTLQFKISFSNLQGNVTQTHIHATTATQFGTINVGVAVGNGSLPGFPLGVTSGTYSNTLDMTLASIYGAGYVTANGGTTAGAEAAVAAALAAGKAYWNIHSSTATGGEIRSFPILTPQLKLVKVQVGPNITLTSTLAATNGLFLAPEYSTNLATPNWYPLTPISSGFLNGTNEMICGVPPAVPAYFRVRAQLIN